MKKFIICFFSFISFYEGYAQTSIGIKAGANAITIFNQITPAPLFSTIKGPVPGYYLGVFKTFNLVPKISFRPELIFSRDGLKMENHYPKTYTTGRFYFLNLPLLLSYKPSEKFSFLAGPEFGYLLKSSAKSKNAEEYESFDLKKRNDVGIALGINYTVSSFMAIELRYSHGFTKLSFGPILYDMQNRTIQLGLAFNIFAHEKLLPTTPIH